MDRLCKWWDICPGTPPLHAILFMVLMDFVHLMARNSWCLICEANPGIFEQKTFGLWQRFAVNRFKIFRIWKSTIFTHNISRKQLFDFIALMSSLPLWVLRRALLMDFRFYCLLLPRISSNFKQAHVVKPLCFQMLFSQFSATFCRMYRNFRHQMYADLLLF